MIRSEFIKVVGDSVGVVVPDEVATSLSDNVEARLRSIIQDAAACMQFTNRTILAVDDINQALKQQSIEPVFGFSSSDPVNMKFTRAKDIPDLLYVEDSVVSTSKVSHEIIQPNKIPTEPTLSVHWLAIIGTQPTIPQNPTVLQQQSSSLAATTSALQHAFATMSLALETAGPSALKRRLYSEVNRSNWNTAQTADSARNSLAKNSGELVMLKSECIHALSLEQHRLLEHITHTVTHGSIVAQNKVFKAIATDISIGALVPFLTQFIATTLAANLPNLAVVASLVCLAESMVASNCINLDPYLHQLLPPILSALVARRIGTSLHDDHWRLRMRAAVLLQSVCTKYGAAYITLQPRITRVLSQTVLDLSRSPATQFGALQGLVRMGPETIATCVIPYIRPLYEHIQEMITLPDRVPTYISAISTNTVTTSPSIPHELTWDVTSSAAKHNTQHMCRVLDVLLRCAGLHIRSQVQTLFFTEIDAYMKGKQAIITRNNNSIKAEQQTGQKMTDETTDVLTALSLKIKTQRANSDKAKKMPKIHTVKRNASQTQHNIDNEHSQSSDSNSCFAASSHPVVSNGVDMGVVRDLCNLMGEAVTPYISFPQSSLASLIL